MNDKVKAWVKLRQVEELGISKATRLINTLGDPVDFIGRDRRMFEDIGLLTEAQRTELASPEDPPKWDEICSLMEKFKIQFVTILDSYYPERLKQTADPPLFLFYRGTLTAPEDERALAVVGTRKPDNYGLMMTKKIADDLVSAGFVIVSGLAYGVDTLAHSVAVQRGKRTIAVLGTGCENIYPPKNEKLAHKIIENGAVISEYIPGTKSEKWFFSQRNRIISALSLGTFVVQGKKNSGALITARYALDQNKDLFALPGDINRPESEGPNYLIKNGAKIVTSSEDIFEEYDLYLFPTDTKEIKLSRQEQRLLDVIRANRPEVSYDRLVIESKFSIGEISAILLSLEMKNLIHIGTANMVSAKD